jgi:hypothetical protein
MSDRIARYHHFVNATFLRCNMTPLGAAARFLGNISGRRRIFVHSKK